MIDHEYSSHHPFEEGRASSLELLELEGEQWPAHLRPVSLDHAEAFFQFLNFEGSDLPQFLPWAESHVLKSYFRIKTYVNDMKENRRLPFFIFYDSPLQGGYTGGMMGFVGLANPSVSRNPYMKTAKLGFYLGEQARNRNYAFRSIQALLAFAQDSWGLTHATLEIASSNQRSQEVAKKLGAVCIQQNAFHMPTSTYLWDWNIQKIPMDVWQLDIDNFLREHPIPDNLRRIYRSALGAMSVQHYIHRGIHEVKKDILRSSSHISLGSSFLGTYACKPLLPILSFAKDNGIGIKAARPPSGHFNLEEEQEAANVLAELVNAIDKPLQDEVTPYFSKDVFAIIDNQLAWKVRNNRFTRVIFERPIEDSALLTKLAAEVF